MLRAAPLPAVLGLLILAACMSPAERPGARATVITDEFSKTIDIEGPMMVVNPFVGIKGNYNLVTHVDKQTHLYTHVIETELDYDGNFIVFQFAADDTAQALQFIPIKRLRNYGCGGLCDRTELFNVVVPDASLHAHASTGYRVKVSARTGDGFILSITPAMIAAQYERLAAVLSPASTPRGAVPVAPVGGQPPTTIGSSQTATGIPFLGIAPMDLLFGAGVMVARVDPGTAAEAAGFQVGDMLVTYDGHPIKKAAEVRELIAKTAPGSVVEIEITRHGTPLTLSAQM